MRSTLQGFHPESEFKSLLDEIRDLFQRGPNLERRLLVALNANVQKLVDDVARNQDLSKSILAAQDLQNKQIADLKSQLASIQPGQPIDDENLTAINALVGTIEGTNAALATAIPASTSLSPTPIPLGNPGAGLTNGTQPVTSDSAGNPIAPDAPGQPGVPTEQPAPPVAAPIDLGGIGAGQVVEQSTPPATPAINPAVEPTPSAPAPTSTVIDQPVSSGTILGNSPGLGTPSPVTSGGSAT